MSYRVIQEGRDRMYERGADPMKIKQYISGMRAMLDEMEESVEEMCESLEERGGYGYGERADYGERGYMGEPMRERRSARTGRFVRG